MSTIGTNIRNEVNMRTNKMRARVNLLKSRIRSRSYGRVGGFR